MTTAAFYPAGILPRPKNPGSSRNRQIARRSPVMRQILLGLVLTAVMAGGLPMARTSIENFGRVAGSMIGPGAIDQSEAVRGAIQQFAPY